MSFKPDEIRRLWALNDQSTMPVDYYVKSHQGFVDLLLGRRRANDLNLTVKVMRDPDHYRYLQMKQARQQGDLT